CVHRARLHAAGNRQLCSYFVSPSSPGCDVDTQRWQLGQFLGGELPNPGPVLGLCGLLQRGQCSVWWHSTGNCHPADRDNGELHCTGLVPHGGCSNRFDRGSPVPRNKRQTSTGLMSAWHVYCTTEPHNELGHVSWRKIQRGPFRKVAP